MPVVSGHGPRLSKTSITLSAICQLLDDFVVDKVLVIAPKFVADDVWSREAEKWDFSANLKLVKILGPEKKRIEALHTNGDIFCINRENTEWLVKYCGRSWPFDMVVIDESSSFKSPRSKRFRALRKVIPLADRVVELTGTPRPRSVEDLWSQIYLLDSGERLGRTITDFRNMFEEPDKRNRNQIWSYRPRAGREEEIYRRIGDISMSMTAEDWLSVPEMITVNHYVNLDDREMKEYQKFAKEYLLEIEKGPEILAANAGVLTGKLLQYAGGCVYDESGGMTIIHNRKIEALREILESTEEPVLVFYWFQSDLDRLQDAFADLNPRTIRSAKDIADWNAGKIRLLLAQPASMGHGLNLQEGPGRTMVWFSLTWSLEAYLQANARLHRQGMKSTVFLHHIIVKNTVDEDVLASLQSKNGDQSAMIEAIKARVEKGEETYGCI